MFSVGLASSGLADNNNCNVRAHLKPFSPPPLCPSVWSGLWIINSTTETKAGHNPNIMTDSAISRWGFFCSSPGTFGCPAGELETSGGAGTSLRTLHITQYTLHSTHLHTPVRPSPSYSWWHSEFTESQIVTWFRLINCCLKFTPFSEETETMTIFQKSINIPF